MKIRIDKLYEGEHRFDTQLEPEALELDTAQFSDPIDVAVLWDRQGPHALMQFQVSTHLNSQCDRCLDDLRLKIDAQIAIVVQLSDVMTRDSDDPDYRIVSPSDVEIDFTADIRDAIILAIPIKILCREDCKGLCPQCGQNLNSETCNCVVKKVNPQWAALSTLKKRV
jgi:uncharacterized protein